VRELIVALAVSAAVAPPAAGVGYYNMPTSLPQSLGMGFGPGYHAPLLLGPKMKAPIAAQSVRRLPAPLPPPACGGFDAPSVWSEAQATSAGPWHSARYEYAHQQPLVGASLLLQAPSVAKTVGPALPGGGSGNAGEVVPAPSPTER
jgi:hypothetical protein